MYFSTKNIKYDKHLQPITIWISNKNIRYRSLDSYIYLFFYQKYKAWYILTIVPINLSNKNIRGNIYLKLSWLQIFIFLSKIWNAVYTCNKYLFIQQKYKAKQAAMDYNIVKITAIGDFELVFRPVFVFLLVKIVR